jgi:long-chain fatty acid transport protein
MTGTRITLTIITLALTCGSLFASQLHQEDGIFPSHSTQYIRKQTRNASTDIDACFYNPAGLAFMKGEGLFINFSTQTVHKRREHTMSYHHIDVSIPTLGMNVRRETENPNAYTNRAKGGLGSGECYFAEVTAPANPDLYLAYKDNVRGHDYVVYLSLGLMQAAPDFTYPRGLAILDWGNMAMAEQINAVGDWLLLGSEYQRYTYESSKAIRTEYFIGMTAGFSMKIIDMLSAALGIRYIYYTGGQEIRIKGIEQRFSNVVVQTLYDGMNSDWHLHTTYQGHGAGIIIGANVRPHSIVNIGLRYEYYPPAELDKRTKKFMAPAKIEATGNLDLFKDGKNRSYYQGGSGSSRLIATYPQSLSLGVSVLAYRGLSIDAGFDLYFRSENKMEGGKEKLFETGYRIGAGAEYFIKEGVAISAGYSYNDPGLKKNNNTESDPLLRSHTIGAGLGIKVDDNMDVNLGFAYILLEDARVDEAKSAASQMEVLGSTIDVYSTSYTTKKFGEEMFLVGLGVSYRWDLKKKQKADVPMTLKKKKEE